MLTEELGTGMELTTALTLGTLLGPLLSLSLACTRVLVHVFVFELKLIDLRSNQSRASRLP
jgi:hypothetical protein